MHGCKHGTGSTPEHCDHINSSIQDFLDIVRNKDWIIITIVIGPHCSTMYVDAAYCYRPSSVVCQTVCRSVTLVSPAKTAEAHRDAIWDEDSGGPRESCPDPSMRRGNFEGEGRPIVKYRDTLRSSVQKTAEPIDMLFGLWAWMDPRNHVLYRGTDHPMGRGNFGERSAHCKVQGLFAVSCAKAAEPVNLPFGLWTLVGRSKHKFNCIRRMAPMCTLAPASKYD